MVLAAKKTILVMTVMSSVVTFPQATAAVSVTQQNACSRDLHRQLAHRPKRLTTAPPAEFTSILGVLRRPAASADELPAEALTRISPYAYSALWLGSARLLDATSDKRYFLVPGVYTPPALPEACVKLEQLHVRRLSAKAPQLGPRGPVVTLEPYSPHDTRGFPFTVSMIQAGRATGIGLGESGPTTAFYGLVPDGVASVAVTAGSAPPRTVLVTSNFFLAQIPAVHMDTPYTITQQWYAADGTLIKTVSMRMLHELSIQTDSEPKGR
jgi:hypothetical protein